MQMGNVHYRSVYIASETDVLLANEERRTTFTPLDKDKLNDRKRLVEGSKPAMSNPRAAYGPVEGIFRPSRLFIIVCLQYNDSLSLIL